MEDFSALDFSAPLQPSTPRRPWPNHSLRQVPCGCTWRTRHPTRKTTLMSALWEHETISNMNSSIPRFALYCCATLRLGCVQRYLDGIVCLGPEQRTQVACQLGSIDLEFWLIARYLGFVERLNFWYETGMPQRACSSITPLLISGTL